jgi:hypothetical protein
MSLIKSIRKLAADFPDAVYTSDTYCEYTKGECGPGKGCIVGQGLQNCGMKWVASYGDSRGEMAVSSLFHRIKVTNQNDRAWLISVQSLQDSTKSWAEAVRLSDASLGQCLG